MVAISPSLSQSQCTSQKSVVLKVEPIPTFAQVHVECRCSNVGTCVAQRRRLLAVSTSAAAATFSMLSVALDGV